MLDSYRQILRVPGSLLFSAAAFVARIPISMMGLGIVLLVEAGTGSYGLGGSVSAAYVVANAGLSIVQGRLLDRLGQARVLVPAALLFLVASALLVASVEGDWPRWTSYPLAAVAGAALPAAGACVRARWSHALHDQPARLQTAFALEAVVDEAVFILGPILVTLLATALDPVVGLATAVLTGFVGTLWLAAQRATEPPVRTPEHDHSGQGRLPWRTLVPLLAATVALGAMFGGAEVVTVAWAEDRGSQAYAGPLLGVWALGSLMAGLITGAIQWQATPATRVRIGALGLCAAMVPLSFIESVPVMAAALLVGGFAIAPTLIALTSLIEWAVPRQRLTEGMAMLHTAVVAGVAPGAALSGVVVDRAGTSAAYLVPLVAAAIGAVSAQALPRSQ
jgi:hypothetical protein